jgi:hypothetical protein
MEKAVLLLPGKLRIPQKWPQWPGRVDPVVAKGGKLPPGTRRTWSGKELSDWPPEVEAVRGGKEGRENVGKWYTHQLSPGELLDFIDEARNGNINKNAWIGVVRTEASERIEAVAGIRVSKIMIESGAVRHAYNKAHHLLEEDDLLHAAEVINNPTSIELSPRKHRDSSVLIFKGNINGEIYFLEALRPKHEGWLSLISCYRPKKAGQGSDAAKTAPRS